MKSIVLQDFLDGLLSLTTLFNIVSTPKTRGKKANLELAFTGLRLEIHLMP